MLNAEKIVDDLPDADLAEVVKAVAGLSPHEPIPAGPAHRLAHRLVSEAHAPLGYARTLVRNLPLRIAATRWANAAAVSQI